MKDLLKISLPSGQVLTAIVLYDGIPSVVFGPSLELSESLRTLPWNQPLEVKYKFRNSEPVKEEVRNLSVGEIMHYIGSDYMARKPPEIHNVSSVDSLLRESSK